MTPLEQHEVLSAITVSLVDALPAGWQRMVVDYAVIIDPPGAFRVRFHR